MDVQIARIIVCEEILSNVIRVGIDGRRCTTRRIHRDTADLELARQQKVRNGEVSGARIDCAASRQFARVA